MNSKIAPILVVACGNVMAGDDAFGAQVLRALERHPMSGVELLDLSTDPSVLLNHLGSRSALIVVDAARVDDLPTGTLIECDWDSPQRTRLAVGQSCGSTHGLGLADHIEMARRLGMLPPVVKLIALSITEAEVGQAQSRKLLRQIRAAARRVRNLAASLAASKPGAGQGATTPQNSNARGRSAG
ncbi:hydrogenase maturation protease [Fontivita pretiosa]|uniref:hydrogenase maturation protease n=1 Tax=Fontivita pretiosa TaxID=2989684 RepID=UPI003D163CE6